MNMLNFHGSYPWGLEADVYIYKRFFPLEIGAMERQSEASGIEFTTPQILSSLLFFQVIIYLLIITTL